MSDHWTMDVPDYDTEGMARLEFAIEEEAWNDPDPSVGEHYGFWDGHARLTGGVLLGKPLTVAQIADRYGLLSVLQDTAFEEWAKANGSPREAARNERADAA